MANCAAGIRTGGDGDSLALWGVMRYVLDAWFVVVAISLRMCVIGSKVVMEVGGEGRCEGESEMKWKTQARQSDGMDLSTCWPLTPDKNATSQWRDSTKG